MISFMKTLPVYPFKPNEVDLPANIASNTAPIKQELIIYRPSDRIQKKNENYAEIFGQIMRKKVSIMRNNTRLCRNF